MVLSEGDAEIKGGAAVMDEQRLKQEYQNWKRQSAPELWDRIEKNLKNYPERKLAKQEIQVEQRNRKTGRRAGRKIFYGAAGAAAVICLMVSVSGWYRGFLVRQGEGKEGYDTVFEAGIAEETRIAKETGIAEETRVAEETGIAGETRVAEEARIAEEAEGAEEANGESKMQSEVILTGNADILRVPEDAVAVPTDSAYFSQAVLADTELVCAGKIDDVSLEYDQQGRAVKVCYQFAVDQVYYAQDYFTGTENITVKSPIIQAEGDEAYLLYQMRKGKMYLLPLKKQEGDWELVYPFAPQVQVTDGQGYLFHSGYSSLVNEETQVVRGEQEGENDYFYDRMLLREDGEFVADFLRLVEEEEEYDEKRGEEKESW